MCANSEGSGETARDAQARQSHRWDSHLCDKYLNLLSWLKFHSNQESPRSEDHSYVGALSQSVWSSILKEASGRLLVNLVPMLEQKKKKKKKHEEVYLFIFFFFFKLGKAQRCHRLGSEKMAL